MPVRICLASCKPRSSSVTWLASATASFSCSGWWVSVPLCSLFATSTGQSSVSKAVVNHADRTAPVSSSASWRKVYDFCYVVGYKSALRNQESKLPLNLFFWNLCLCVCFRAWKLLGSTYVDCMYTTLMWRTDCTTTFYLTLRNRNDFFLVSKSNQYLSFAPIFS